MASQEELVDILEPPMFYAGGKVKTREQAHDDGDWIGTFNLWIVTKDPVPSIVYQRRSLQKKWAPGLLDVAAGGHYTAGEKLADGLREVEEELGKHYKVDEIKYLGRSMFVSLDVKKRRLNEVVEVYMTEDSGSLSDYKLQEEEVDALVICPVEDLLKVNREEGYSFETKGVGVDGRPTILTVTKASFPVNWNDYHYKMAVLADRYFRGDTDLLF